MQGWLAVYGLCLVISLIFTTVSLSILQPRSNHIEELGCFTLASQYQLCLKLVCQINLGPASLDTDSLAQHVGLSLEKVLSMLCFCSNWPFRARVNRDLDSRPGRCEGLFQQVNFQKPFQTSSDI